ncbi:MAG: alpha/beta fold hydrolase [Gemmatimonadaceae bacterium]
MRYQRAGAGRPVIVLCGASEVDALWPELDTELVSRFRVITPEIPADCDDVAAWVAAFLEGVGLDRVVVLAAESCCLSALELALFNAYLVERLVLVPAGAVSETGLDGTLATTLAGVSVPLIVVRRGLSAAVALPLLRNFLEHEGHTATVG